MAYLDSERAQLDRAAPAQSASAFSRGMRLVLRHTDTAVMYQDRDLRVVWAENLPASLHDGDLRGATEQDYLPRDEADRITQLKTDLVQSPRSAKTEVSIATPSRVASYTFWIDPDRAPDGSVQGLVTTIVDVTAQKVREQTLRSLLRDVSHRSKNLLAIIQSLAVQTGRYSGNIESFLTRLRGRLQSLASSQDLVTSSDWRGAELRELMIGQIGRYCADPGRMFELKGDNPYLSPNAALHIGLALHELAVNSATFGALSRPGGRIALEAGSVRDEAGERSLVITWTEEMPPGTMIADKKFGSIALERVVPAALNGEGHLSTEGSKLEYRLVVPGGGVDFD